MPDVNDDMIENMDKSMFCRQSHPCGDVRQTDRQTSETDRQTLSDRQADCIIDCLVMIAFGRSRVHLAHPVN